MNLKQNNIGVTTETRIGSEIYALFKQNYYECPNFNKFTLLSGIVVNVGFTRVVIVTFAEELFSSMAVGTKFTDEKPILVAIRSLSDFAQIDFKLKIKLSKLLSQSIILQLGESLTIRLLHESSEFVSFRQRFVESQFIY